MSGTLAIVLHAHLPFVRHPEQAGLLEEDWLYEAISETYLPLLVAFERLADEAVPCRVTLSLSAPLTSMLRDELLMRRYGQRLDELCELSEREVARTAGSGAFEAVARFYRERLFWLRELFHERYRGELVAAFRRLQERGALELLCTGATHGFLPLMQHCPAAARAQVRLSASQYRQLFGRDAPGFWLPECGYYPGVERVLAAEGLRYCVVDTHGVTDAEPSPAYGPWAPVFTEAGVALFARDPASSQQVWSADHGFPGDPVYREFYRDIGWELPPSHLGPFVLQGGGRKNTGLKYHRITGRGSHKEPYDREAAVALARAHARQFVVARAKQLRSLAAAMGGREPILVAPYDAELFGHWWFEGPEFLEAALREAAALGVFVSTPSDYLRRWPEHQVVSPALSSWGEHGYASMWLDPSNDWVYEPLHRAATRMVALANQFPDADELPRRALNQAARELLLAQASDWAFIMKTGTMVDYAVRRTREHLSRFFQLDEQLTEGRIDRHALAALEAQDNLFQELDYRVYQTSEGPPG